MCGIAAVVGGPGEPPRIERIEAMVDSQRHRGPDACGTHAAPGAALGHTRLSIIDLSAAGQQPMRGANGSLAIVFNGEIYNYVELREALDDYPYRTATDTEVILAAYDRWGESCLNRFLGMFAFAIWDERQQRLFAARDRFGVKPLYYHQAADGTLLLASEIKALHAAGVPRVWDEETWATYLTHGVCDHAEQTFWEGIRAVPPGAVLTWQDDTLRVSSWYSLAAQVGTEFDARSDLQVRADYVHLMSDSLKLRFRSDVPAGINLSGGLDSSLLLAFVQAGDASTAGVRAFTFVCGDPAYDELPWVERMLAHTRHPLSVCRLDAEAVPALAEVVTEAADEPFGGLPTLAYAQVFARARAEGVTVLLDGQGLDEQWAGYDYYRTLLADGPAPVVQGTSSAAVRPDCLTMEFKQLARVPEFAAPFGDEMRNLQYRDLRYTKIPRALRFNDRVSMRYGTELREPFLDHRLVELALRQPPQRKIRGGTSKWLLRSIASEMMPTPVALAPKRPVQTPQREWLRGRLREWAAAWIEAALDAYGGVWLDTERVRRAWHAFCQGESDNSFYVWQWISMGLTSHIAGRRSLMPLSRTAVPLSGNQAPASVRTAC